MNIILEKHLKKKYPKLFRDLHCNPKKSCMSRGCECGDGWYLLLDTLCTAIQHHINYSEWEVQHKYRQIPVPQVVFTQVKEKFGALTIYHKGGDAHTSSIIAFANFQSKYICENCGVFNTEVGRTDKGWIQSLCYDCSCEYDRPISRRIKEIAVWQKVIASRKNPYRSWKTIEELTPEDFKQPNKKRKK